MLISNTHSDHKGILPKGTLSYVPLGTSFIPALAQGLLARFGPTTTPLSHVVVLLPTRRGCLALKQAFMRVQKDGAFMLPRIIALADLENFPLLPGFMPATELSDALSDWQRQGLLTKLVLAFEKQKFDRTHIAIATALARELMTLIDEAATSAIDLNKIHDLVSSDYAQHWQLTLDFLKILTEAWPDILESYGKIDASLRNREHLMAIAQEWQPTYPVVLAGTTGTRPATACLAKSILQMPQGHVVLPGMDTLLTVDLWSTLPPSHPQYVLAQFLIFLGKTSGDCQSWIPYTQAPSTLQHTQRQHLLSRAMRPLLYSDTKTADIPMDLGSTANLDPTAMDGIHMVTCHTKQEEARVIALMIRQELAEPTRTIALITPDQDLTRRVTAELQRWHISPNSSSGYPLHQTVVGTFLQLTANVHQGLSASEFLALLKHPLCYKHQDRFDHLCTTRSFEKKILRRLSQPFDRATFQLSNAFSDDFKTWYERIDTDLAAFTDLSATAKPLPLSQWITAHMTMAERLCGATEEAHLWTQEDGQTAKNFFDQLLQDADYFPDIHFHDYAPLLQTLMAQKTVRDVTGIGSRVLILGTLEARLQDADVAILGGLNEGTWPAPSQSDPWLSRPMRLSLGLPDPERKIGLSAHDFCLGFSSPTVYLTRSLKVDGAPTIPSRWWQRLETILAANHIMPPQMAPWLTWCQQLEAPQERIRLAPPMPCPPMAVRPRVYTVTDMGTLMRDPYAIYAKYVLKLQPLLPLDQNLSAKERGQLIHEALDLFYQRYGTYDGKNALERLYDCGREVFAPVIHQPLVMTFWWTRFERIAQWLIHQWQQETHQITRTSTEIAGHLDVFLSSGKVTIKAIADRIDVLRDGSLRILDYKTGHPPTLVAVKKGLSPQLALEALIFQTPTTPVTQLAYWHLQGTTVGGKITNFKNVEELIAEAKTGMTQLLASFSSPQTPYLACPNPEYEGFNDYEHLERIREWRCNL